MSKAARKPAEQLDRSPRDSEQAARAATQRVQMPRAELELYVTEGRPTGLLLRSVALLKGMDDESVAKASGIPVALVKSILGGDAIAAIKNGTIKKVASVLGIDLSSMRFASGQVHVFDLARLPRFIGKSALRMHLRGVGLLARSARVAELTMKTTLIEKASGRTMFVAQSETFRGLFVSGGLNRFELDHIPGGQWARAKRADSVVAIENRDLMGNLRSRDVTESEFDELFMGSKAFTWDALRVAARANGVSKDDLMAFIRSRAAELDASEDSEAKRVANEARPSFLRLVDTEAKVAFG